MPEGTGKWSVWGYDTFEGGDAWYPVEADRTVSPRRMKEYDTEEEALDRAHKYWGELERAQPTSQSGGQGALGIQDRVFVQRPDGTRKRIFPSISRPWQNQIQ